MLGRLTRPGEGEGSPGRSACSGQRQWCPAEQRQAEPERSRVGQRPADAPICHQHAACPPPWLGLLLAAHSQNAAVFLAWPPATSALQTLLSRRAGTLLKCSFWVRGGVWGSVSSQRPARGPCSQSQGLLLSALALCQGSPRDAWPGCWASPAPYPHSTLLPTGQPQPGGLWVPDRPPCTSSRGSPLSRPLYQGIDLFSIFLLSVEAGPRRPHLQAAGAGWVAGCWARAGRTDVLFVPRSERGPGGWRPAGVPAELHGGLFPGLAGPVPALSGGCVHPLLLTPQPGLRQAPAPHWWVMSAAGQAQATATFQRAPSMRQKAGGEMPRGRKESLPPFFVGNHYFPAF